MNEMTDLPTLDERPGPAERMSPEAARALVDKVLAAHARGGAVPRVRRFAAAAVLALAFGGAAASAGYVVQRWREPPAATPIAPPVASEAPRPAARAQRGAPSRPPEESTDTGAASEPASVELAGGRRSASRSGAPADRLRAANALRAQSRWRDAERSYRQVAAGTPGSEEAYAAAVAAASLRLDHLGDPAGALPLYQGALRTHPTGALAEEARWGIARAHRALGNSEREAQALRAFVAAHPRSLMRPTAEARLATTASAGAAARP